MKVDRDVRDRARKVSQRIGVPLSMVVNQELRRFADERRVEFREPLIPNAKTRKILDEALKDIREGREDKFSGPFSTAKEMDKYLDSLKK